MFVIFRSTNEIFWKFSHVLCYLCIVEVNRASVLLERIKIKKVSVNIWKYLLNKWKFEKKVRLCNLSMQSPPNRINCHTWTYRAYTKKLWCKKWVLMAAKKNDNKITKRVSGGGELSWCREGEPERRRVAKVTSTPQSNKTAKQKNSRHALLPNKKFAKK